MLKTGFSENSGEIRKKRGELLGISPQRMEEIKHSKYKEVHVYRITFGVQS